MKPMKQLLMERDNKPVIIPSLPEGYHLRTYREGDWKSWVEVCAHGLGTGRWTEAEFKEHMLDMDGLRKDGIFLIENEQARVVGTATGWVKPDNGYLHMVAVHPDFRGRGLAGVLNTAAVVYLLKRGCKRIVLDTDDERLPAIRSYLKLGFRPVLYQSDMQMRWEAIMATIGLVELEALNRPGGKRVTLRLSKA